MLGTKKAQWDTSDTGMTGKVPSCKVVPSTSGTDGLSSSGGCTDWI